MAIDKQALFYGLGLLFLISLPAWADPSGHGHNHSTSLGGEGSGFASAGGGSGAGSPPPSSFGGGGQVSAPPPPPPQPVKLSSAGTVQGTGAGARSKTLDIGVPDGPVKERRVRSLSSIDGAESSDDGAVVRIGRRSTPQDLE